MVEIPTAMFIERSCSHHGSETAERVDGELPDKVDLDPEELRDEFEG